MFKLNYVVLSGRLTRDIDLKYTNSGTAVASLDLAFDRGYKDASGNWQNKANFIRVKLWSRLAERSAENLSKGDPVTVEGSLEMESYTTKDGTEKKSIVIVARSLHYDWKKDDSVKTDDDVPF